MKKYLISCAIIFLGVNTSRAEDVIYDGYEAYYATFPNLIFNKAEKLEAEMVTWEQDIKPGINPAESDAELRFSWTGLVAGKEHFISVGDDTILVDGHALLFRPVIKFPDDVEPSYQPLGKGPVLYTGNTSYICLEGNNSNGRTGDRYTSVYLFDVEHLTPPVLYKLPSLFASCLNIRLDARKNFVFDKASYRYKLNSEQLEGLNLIEYFMKDKRFISTGNKVVTKFIESENVFKFSIFWSGKAR